MKPYHFYLAFNPLFNEDHTWVTQAHEFHHHFKEKKKVNKHAHMYWGKIQISEHSEALNVSHFQQVLVENKDLLMDTHIYITDYQHLWVGKVTEALKEIPDQENSLDFYKNKRVEVWFKLEDFDLVSNNAEETLGYLNQIHVDNEYYHYKIHQMSPFTSGIRFPMIVQDRTQVRFFKQNQNDVEFRLLQENPLLSSQGEGIRLNHLIQSFVIPEDNFKRLPNNVRSMIIQAEILLVEAQASGNRDRVKLEQAILSYLTCLEIMLNETFVAYLKKVEGYRIWVTNDHTNPKFIRSAIDKDKTTLVRLKDSMGRFNLTQIKMLLDNPTYFPHTSLDFVFQEKKSFWEYCRLELRPTLKNESLIDLKNNIISQTGHKAHDRELLLVRNILLGVGGNGLFNDIIESWYEIDKTKKKAA
jgi:hypothetical protein